MTPRFVIIGAGAIGGTIAVQLHRAGHHVEVVARGDHLQAIRRGGLTRVAPDGSVTVRLTARAQVREVRLTPDSIVIVATKVHQAEVVLDQLLAHGGPDVPVVCAQNGVDGERMALRRFHHVYGMLVNVPGVHLTPGEVQVFAAAPRGLLDVGRYPSGVDERARLIASALTDAQFTSEACEDIMARKWAKLLGNVGNALQVLCGADAPFPETLYGRLRAEAEAAVAAAGITVDFATQQHRATLVARDDIGGVARPGGSTWQSAIRGTGDVETLALNGEICLLGRLHGVPTPANDLVQAQTVALVAGGGEIGSWTEADLLARLDRMDQLDQPAPPSRPT